MCFPILSVHVQNMPAAAAASTSPDVTKLKDRIDLLEKQSKMFVTLGQGLQSHRELENKKIKNLEDEVTALKKENKIMISTMTSVNTEVGYYKCSLD